MKSIRLRDFPEDRVTTKDVLLSVVRQADPNRGLNIEEMGRRWEVMKKLDAADDVAILEDAEYELVRNLYEKFPFRGVQECFLEMLEDIKNPIVPEKTSNGGAGAARMKS